MISMTFLALLFQPVNIHGYKMIPGAPLKPIQEPIHHIAKADEESDKGLEKRLEESEVLNMLLQSDKHSKAQATYTPRKLRADQNLWASVDKIMKLQVCQRIHVIFPLDDRSNKVGFFIGFAGPKMGIFVVMLGPGWGFGFWFKGGDLYWLC